MKINILDCTFRDEGYYNNWNFSNEEFDNYIAITNNLPIDYIEIGYLNVKKNYGNFGRFFYLNNNLKHFKSLSIKKFA